MGKVVHTFFGGMLVLAMILTNLSAFAETAESKDTPAESQLAELSDEQVRRMLLDELQADLKPVKEFDAEKDIGGIAGPISNLLKTLEDESDESSARFAKLWESLPEILPDLYKVFTSL